MIAQLSPWFVLYMWIAGYILIFIFSIIFIAKLIQYFRRWGYSKADGYTYQENIINLTKNKASVPILTIRSQDGARSNKVLIITPFTVSSKRFLYFATAIALKNYEVILVESRVFLKKCRKDKHDIMQATSELVSIISPNIIIAADVFFQLLRPMLESVPEKKFVFLRPLVRPSQLSLGRVFPFTSRWFYVIYMRLNKIHQLIHDTEGIDAIYTKKHSKTLMIWPKKPSKGVIRDELSNPKQVVERSRFSFRDVETLVFAKILYFIDGVSS